MILSKLKFWFRNAKYFLFGMERRYKAMSHAEIFDKVYSIGAWGKDANGRPTSGSGSYKKHIIKPYINAISDFLSEVKPTTIVDLGCGDFNIGKNFVTLTEKYIACDVSSVILQRNKENYSDLKNVEFIHMDIANDKLPVGDVAFVRQVLQHLSNDAIQKFATQLNQHKPFKHLLVTEHLPVGDSFKVNIDKPAGSKIRVGLNGGVVLHEAPFSLSCKSHKTFLELKEDVSEQKAVIRTTLYNF